MTLGVLLNGLLYDGQISVRRKTKHWFEYVCSSQERMHRLYADCVVVKSCIIDNVLVICVL